MDAVDVIRLSTGESLMVEVVSVNDDFVTVNHPALGSMTIPRSAVAEIVYGVERSTVLLPTAVTAPTAESVTESATETDGATPDPAAAAAAESAEIAAAAEPDPERWKFKLTFAGGGAAGNTENINALIRFRADQETETTRVAFDTSYFYGSTDGEKTDSRFTVGLRHDWLVPESRWFYFARGRYDYDEFQSWLHRVQGFGGVGYRLIEPPKLAFDLLAGLGAIKEWKSDNDDVRLEGLFGFEGAYDIAEQHRIEFASTIYPDFTDVGQFRWVSSFGWSWRFNSKSPMALSAGLEHEYQSQVNPGRDKNDVRVFAGLDWDF